MVKYQPTFIHVLHDDHLLGWICEDSELSHKRYTKWALYTFKWDKLFEGSSVEQCQENIHLLENWWEEDGIDE
jgi:hypothetical protein